MLANLIVVLYALLPFTLLNSHSLPSGVFYALVVANLTLLFQKRFAGVAVQTKNYRLLIASYSVLFLAVTASSLYHGEWAGSNSEGALRFFLGVWILLASLPYIEVSRLRHAMWGVYIAAISSTAILFWLVVNSKFRPETPALIIVTYTSLMLLLSVILLYSMKWQLTPWPRIENALKALVAAATFTVFLSAQTRTGLLGMPVFVLLALVLFIGTKRPGRMIALLLISIAALTTAVANSDAMRDRITQGIQEVQACQGEKSTQTSSMCIRLQLWRTAIDGGINYPWMGLGDSGKFSQYVKEVAIPKGWTTQYIVKEYFGEPHNDLLLVFFGFGFPGILGLLLIYFVPCTYFLPRLFRQADPQARAAAAMGLAVCLGFFFFGLTETMFRRMNTIGFYTAMVALFMVLSEPKPSRQDKPAPPALP